MCRAPRFQTRQSFGVLPNVVLRKPKLKGLVWRDLCEEAQGAAEVNYRYSTTPKKRPMPPHKYLGWASANRLVYLGSFVFVIKRITAS
jgi:hypothetical protein